MKKIISVTGIAVLLLLKIMPACAQTGSGDLISKLKNYSQSHITEKVYLQFDKPYYAAGDTVYFKAYVTMGARHDLSKISGVLHADLITASNKIDYSIKLQLVNGIAWGDFALPDSLPAGNYRIRAYTQWMRNSGPGSYFEKMIPVGALYQQKVAESSAVRIKPVLPKPDLQFFPEGGDMVTGISSKVAFKAVGTNGLGIAVKGDITDNTGKLVTSFASIRLGMGCFWLKPEEGKTYSANVTFANGAKSVLQLQTFNEKGITLSVNNDSLPVAAVKIEANAAYYQANKGREYNLLIYSGGYATTVNCKLDSQVIKLAIIKRRLFTGIARVTLFLNDEPLCERLFFVQNFDQLNLNVSSDKSIYPARGKVTIMLNAKTRADSASAGHFSVSVTDESKVPVNENEETTILSNLLLTSDLKGYVEQPNYYFTDPVISKLKELDLVMLTHGYSRFEWKQVLDYNNNTTMSYLPERSLSISGTAENLLGKPLSKAIVSLISMENRRFISDTTDDKGHFKFSGMFFTDTARYVLQAVNAKGKNRTQLVYDPGKPPAMSVLAAGSQSVSSDTLMHAYMDNDENVQDQLIKSGMGKVRILKEVKINDYHSSNIMGPGHADQVLHEEDIGYTGGMLSDRLNGKLRGINIINGTPFLFSRPMAIFLDYNQIKSLDAVNPNDIETVEVLKMGTASVYGISGGYGVIVLTSKSGKATQLNDIASIGVLPIAVQGFYKAREFYAPKYDAPAPQNNRADLRSTIYWQPELTTDKDGNASFEFYNADGTGNYRVVVEGIDSKGNIGRQVYRYRVE